MVENLGRSVRRGLVWSMAATLTLRFGNLAVGIVLARLLTPEQFGVFAVALTVQAILMTLVDLGLTADLVRTDEPERLAPTVATLSLGLGAAFAMTMALTAGQTAQAFNAPDAAPVILAMSFTLVISGAGVVPVAMLQRAIEQRKLFIASLADFTVSTVVTIALVLLGLGPLSLAIGRLAAQVTATTLQFVLSGRWPRFGFDRSQAGPALAYGIPVAGANLLSWALISIDNVVVARVADATALGFYVLAFNIASWPMNAIGQAVRSVSLAAFSHTNRERIRSARGVREDQSLIVGAVLSWTAGLPAGILLAALSVPLIRLLYGDQWTPSAAALASLGLFGALRVVFDTMATYLLARGAARPVFGIQAVWMIALVPALIFSVSHYGIAGAGYAHVATGLIVVLPAYLFVVHRLEVDIRKLVRMMLAPTLAAIPSWAVAGVVASRFDSPLGALVCGALAGAGVYLLVLAKWLAGLRRSLRTTVESTNEGEDREQRKEPSRRGALASTRPDSDTTGNPT